MVFGGATGVVVTTGGTDSDDAVGTTTDEEPDAEEVDEPTSIPGIVGVELGVVEGSVVGNVGNPPGAVGNAEGMVTGKLDVAVGNRVLRVECVETAVEDCVGSRVDSVLR